MNKIGIFFGSDTGNTEFVAKLIKKKLYPEKPLLLEITNANKEIIDSCNIIFFGISTWYYGDMQSDWEDFIPIFKKINFKNKKIALFGCGDQEDYSEYFCDAVGLLYIMIQNQNGKVIGKWPTKNYYYVDSKALLNKDFFCGLLIDLDRQPKLTKKRVKKWLSIIKKEIN